MIRDKAFRQFYERFENLQPGVLTEEELIECIHDCEAFMAAYLLSWQTTLHYLTAILTDTIIPEFEELDDLLRAVVTYLVEQSEVESE